MKIPTPSETLARLEALCSRSEQCSADIRIKLRRYGYPAQTIEQILASLVDNRYVDDSRFARAYVHDKYLFARWGRFKIRMGLRAKQIAADVTDAAIESEIDPATYRDLLRQLLHAKSRGMDRPLSPADRQRLLRSVAARGYEPALILDLVREICASDGYDEVD